MAVEHKNEPSEAKCRKNLRWLAKKHLVLFCMSIGAVFWMTIVGGVAIFSNCSLKSFAEFGDSMAFVSMIAAAAALIFSSKELGLQRQEMKDQRKEMRESKEAQQESARAQEKLANAQLVDSKIRKWEKLLDMCNRMDDDVKSQILYCTNQENHWQVLLNAVTLKSRSSVTEKDNVQLWHDATSSSHQYGEEAQNGLTDIKLLILEHIASSKIWAAENEEREFTKILRRIYDIDIKWLTRNANGSPK